MNCPCQPDLSPLNGLQGKNERRSFGRPTPSSPTKKYRGSWGQTTRNSAFWHRYEVVPYPLGRHEMSPREKTCTPQCLKALLTQWQKPPDRRTTDTLSRRGFLKRPLMTSNEQESRHNESIQNDHLKKPHPDTKKTEERSISTYHAKMGCAVPPSGSSAW